AWSRFRVVIPTWDKTMGTLVACLDATLRRLGGAPTYLLSENVPRNIFRLLFSTRLCGRRRCRSLCDGGERPHVRVPRHIRVRAMRARRAASRRLARRREGGVPPKCRLVRWCEGLRSWPGC